MLKMLTVANLFGNVSWQNKLVSCPRSKYCALLRFRLSSQFIKLASPSNFRFLVQNQFYHIYFQYFNFTQVPLLHKWKARPITIIGIRSARSTTIITSLLLYVQSNPIVNFSQNIPRFGSYAAAALALAFCRCVRLELFCNYIPG